MSEQLLFEWITAYDLGRKPARNAWQRGALVSGINWVAADSLELLADAGATLPQPGIPVGFQASFGFIATLAVPD